MQYMLLIHSNEAHYATVTPQEMETLMTGYATFTQEVQEAGILRSAARLRPTATATTVQVREEKTLTTDGPFAETKEQLGGYYTLDCKDLDEAIRWATKIPTAAYGSVEIRPVWDEE